MHRKPIDTAKRNYRFAHAISGLIACLITIFISVAGLVWYAQSALTKEAERSATRVLTQIELILRNAQQAATDATTLINKDCVSVLLQLRKIVQATLYVRSINLFRDSTDLYCSSLVGPLSEKTEGSEFVDGRLQLLLGNPITPLTPLVVYRHSNHHSGVLVGIDGRHITGLIAMLHGDSRTRVMIGDRAIGDGAVPLGRTIAQGTARSSVWPVAVQTSYSMTSFQSRLRDDYLGLYILFILLGCASGIRTYWFLGRSPCPKAEIDRALSQEEFVPYLQPIVRASDRRWVGAEVLARWHHPQQGVLPPSAFIMSAEESGQIVPITISLIEQLMIGISHVDLPRGFFLSLNVTSSHFNSGAFLDCCRSFKEVLSRRSIELYLELTERSVFTADQDTLDAFRSLRKSGVQFAIDDFGTGYSSLAYLHQFKIDAVKVDRMFVSNLGANSLSRELVLNILDLGERLGLKTVAEGVETEAQCSLLRGLGAHFLQGYLFSRPLPLARFLARLPRNA